MIGLRTLLGLVLGSTTDFTPDANLITQYHSTGPPRSMWHLSRSLGSGGLGTFHDSSSLYQSNIFIFYIFCYDLISTDPTIPTVFLGGGKVHGKRVI
ncbi:hypothetical protein EDB83DRAFT_1208390 [Lactarius deliciosus]|nr:hypothetical protein EDB83DRAFT_1208390 [Lactarius deliciosus]